MSCGCHDGIRQIVPCAPQTQVSVQDTPRVSSRSFKQTHREGQEDATHSWHLVCTCASLKANCVQRTEHADEHSVTTQGRRRTPHVEFPDTGRTSENRRLLACLQLSLGRADLS